MFSSFYIVLTLFVTFGSPPLDSSNSTTKWCPALLASCNGVDPYCNNYMIIIIDNSKLRI